MTNNQIKNGLLILGGILGILVSLFTLNERLQNLSAYAIIIVFSLLLIVVNLYFKYSLKEVSGREKKEYKNPRFHESKLTLYSLIAIPIIAIAVCRVIYITQSGAGVDRDKTIGVANNRAMPCDRTKLAERSICIAKFSDEEKMDRFSQYLIRDLSGKTNPDELSVIDHDKFIYAGRNLKQQIDSIQYTHCIDTGIIVHGMRSKEDSVFSCSIHFLNYQRRDTLIENPDKIEFTFMGHAKYLSNFLLAQNESSNEQYRYALDLFLDAKLIGNGDEFNSIIDFYIGNMYFNLNVMDSARMYYKRASTYSSSVRAYALNRLKLTNLEPEEFGISEDVSEETIEKREEMISMYNEEFKGRVSRYFDIKKNLHKEIRFTDFTNLTTRSWELDKYSEFTSNWMILRNDSLYFFEMTTKNLGDVNKPKFSSWVKKVWAISSKGQLLCRLTSQGHWRKGWNVDFSSNASSKNAVRVNYRWIYFYRYLGQNPLNNNQIYSIESEVVQIEKFKSVLGNYFDQIKITYTLKDEIDLGQLEIPY